MEFEWIDSLHELLFITAAIKPGTDFDEFTAVLSPISHHRRLGDFHPNAEKLHLYAVHAWKHAEA